MGKERMRQQEKIEMIKKTTTKFESQNQNVCTYGCVLVQTVGFSRGTVRRSLYSFPYVRGLILCRMARAGSFSDLILSVSSEVRGRRDASVHQLWPM